MNQKAMRNRAHDVLDTIERDFALGNGLYKNVYGKNDAAFCWSLAVLLSAYAAAARWDSKRYTSLRNRLTEALDREYFHTAGPTPGYNASRVTSKTQTPDRYYDDNIWLALAVAPSVPTANGANQNGFRKAYLFTLSGMDEDYKGVFWHEQEKTTMNTCSAAPLALSFNIDAKRPKILLRRGINNSLRDPADGLYWDNIDVKTGKLEKTKWSYNSALMLQLNVQMSEYDTSASQDAVVMGAACIARWYDEKQSILRDDAAFAHHLLEALVCLYLSTKDKKYLRPVENTLETVWKIRRKNGHFPKRWSTEPDDAPCELLWIASAARAFAFAGDDTLWR